MPFSGIIWCVLLSHKSLEADRRQVEVNTGKLLGHFNSRDACDDDESRQAIGKASKSMMIYHRRG